ncbi:MAG: class I SAM-dependent methyltransferase [Halothiobacillaceae bacterium]|nr:class I SAM-dependent methyltransferase [Halothiobacillaceae bacterium]
MTAIQPWPADGLESVPICPVCGHAQREVLYTDLTDRVFNVAPGTWTLYRCTQCESAYLDPRPNEATIGLAYASYYTHEATDHPIVRRKGVVRAFVHDAMNGYRNARYGLNRQPSIQAGRWLIPLLPSLRAAVDAQCRHLPRPPAGGGRLLDVGFGNGGFLQLASEMGWNAEGIDFDAQAVEVAQKRGLNVRCISADTFHEATAQYDVITLSHVIEHVYDPVGLLKALYAMLKPGGMLWLDTPNLDSKGHARFGRNWRGLEPPRHLVLFGGQTLFGVLQDCGFVDLRRLWRGLSVFDVFPVSEALTRDTDTAQASRQGKPPLREILAELDEMLRPARREFITLSAIKPVSA